ncbi:MAG: MBL fold metallo-hydrolase [Bryobacteraceae bacterium]
MHVSKVVTALLLATLAFAQNRDPVVPETPVRVSEHIQELIAFPNVVIVTGSDATLVVDTGLGPKNGETVTRVARKLAQGKGQRLYLTTTHFHPEHAAGEAGFPKDTILIRNTVQQKELEEHGMEMVQRFAMNPQWSELLKDVKSLRKPDITFDRELTLDLGGVTARLLYYGDGHTRGDQVIMVEPDSALITGDLVQNKVVPTILLSGGISGSSAWIATLDQLAPLKPKIIVPTHSRVGDGSLIAGERAFIVDLRTRTLALKTKGIPVEDAAKEITEQFKSAYPEWAANADWTNLASVPGFVRRIYSE